MLIARFVFVLGLFLVACGPSMTDLRTRAAFDFECPEQQITLTKLASYTYGATGCDRRGTYVMDGTTGSWILNPDGDRAQ